MIAPRLALRLHKLLLETFIDAGPFTRRVSLLLDAVIVDVEALAR